MRFLSSTEGCPNASSRLTNAGRKATTALRSSTPQRLVSLASFFRWTFRGVGESGKNVYSASIQSFTQHFHRQAVISGYVEYTAKQLYMFDSGVHPVTFDELRDFDRCRVWFNTLRRAQFGGQPLEYWCNFYATQPPTTTLNLPTSIANAS